MSEVIIFGVFVLLGLVLVFLPKRVYQWVEKQFGFSKRGIRYIRRRKDSVDSLGNMFLFIGIVFSMIYFLIPYYSIVYSILLLFFFLCSLAQGYRVMKKSKKTSCFLVCFCLYLIFITGVLMNLFNGLDGQVLIFKKDLMTGSLFDIFYILTNGSLMAYLLQAVMFMIPVYALISQFKYMRLENTFKAVHLVTYVFKAVFVCVVLFILSREGLGFLNIVYQVQYKKA